MTLSSAHSSAGYMHPENLSWLLTWLPPEHQASPHSHGQRAHSWPASAAEDYSTEEAASAASFTCSPDHQLWLGWPSRTVDGNHSHSEADPETHAQPRIQSMPDHADEAALPEKQSRRQKQNRQSQQNYRNKQKNHIRELEAETAQWKRKHDSLVEMVIVQDRELESLRRQVATLESTRQMQSDENTVVTHGDRVCDCENLNMEELKRKQRYIERLKQVQPGGKVGGIEPA